ncbi:MAG: peptidoglycan editing factor PgeF [Nitrospinae bacterium]|nr:peptidoglycan editing factor PgeF [Nitrospinota bacterium]
MNEVLRRFPCDGPEIYTFPHIQDLGFANFITGRGGGVSAKPYDSLNTSHSDGDSPENVRRNMELIKSATGAGLIWAPSQVHGAQVAVIDGAIPERPVEADAVITARKGIAVGVRTADCLPILIADPEKNVAAAVHAGRKGAELHIVSRAVEIMAERFGCDPENLHAAFGPCIRSCCYAVDEATAERFHACCGGDGGLQVDIADANLRQLADCGVKGRNIADSGVCTSCHNRKFYSYRKDGKVTGRFISLVAVR